MYRSSAAAVVLSVAAALLLLADARFDPLIRLPSDGAVGGGGGGGDAVGTRWAMLIAGSSGLGNYRHQDYVGDDVTVKNFFAVLLGDMSALTGGSGKVVDSGPDDHIFVFYSDHGGPGVLGMPTSPYLYAYDLVEVLKKKHALGSYKSLVFYLKACESGSIFEGLIQRGVDGRQ